MTLWRKTSNDRHFSTLQQQLQRSYMKRLSKETHTFPYLKQIK